MIEEFFTISPALLEKDKEAMQLCRPEFETIDRIKE